MGREVFIGKKRTNKPNTGGATVDNVTVSALSTNSRNLQGGVQIVADEANTGIVYIGFRDNLTAGTNNETDGFPLSAGESFFAPVDKEDEIRLLATIAAQGVHYASF